MAGDSAYRSRRVWFPCPHPAHTRDICCVIESSTNGIEIVVE
jgi:hypothetical protein